MWNWMVQKFQTKVESSSDDNSSNEEFGSEAINSEAQIHKTASNISEIQNEIPAKKLENEEQTQIHLEISEEQTDSKIEVQTASNTLKNTEYVKNTQKLEKSGQIQIESQISSKDLHSQNSKFQSCVNLETKIDSEINAHAELNLNNVMLKEQLEEEEKQFGATDSTNTFQSLEKIQIKSESLKNLHADFISMPSCSEKSILTLIYHVTVKLLCQLGNISANDPTLYQEKINAEYEFKFLQEHLKIEELSSLEIVKYLEASQKKVQQEDWKSAQTNLKNLLKIISPLNINEMKRLINKANYASCLIEGKDVILLLGETGCGKSTMIHFLAGSEMKTINVEIHPGKYLPHITPTGKMNDELSKIITSPFVESETRYIAPVTIELQEICKFKTGVVIVCDTPGFGDTAGPEVDIANGIGLVNAIRKCKSVKPVILFSSMSAGNRAEGFKRLAHTLVGLMPGIIDESEGYLQCFSYFFTKYSEDQKDIIHALLLNIKDKMIEEEQSDTAYVNLFNDLLEKTQYGAQVINPLTDNHKKILNDLIKSPYSIKRPDEVFRCTATEASKSVLKEQLDKHRISILSAIKRCDYALINHKLDELQFLSEIMNQDDNVRQVYDICVLNLVKHMNEEYDRSVKTLNRCLTMECELTDDDIKQYQQQIYRAEMAENLRKTHLGKDAVNSEAFLQNLNNQISCLVNLFKEKKSDDNIGQRNILNKLKVVSISFGYLTTNYDDACYYLLEQFSALIESFQKLINCNEFHEAATTIKKQEQFITLFADYLGFQKLEEKYKYCKKYLANYLSNFTSQLEPLFQVNAHAKLDIDKLNNCMMMLDSLKNAFCVQNSILPDIIIPIYDLFLENFLNYLESVLEKVKNICENEVERSFEDLEKVIREMDLIRSTVSVQEFKTSEYFFRALDMVCSFVLQLRHDIEKVIMSLLFQNDNVDYTKLSNSLSCLKQIKWINEFKSEVYKDLQNAVEQPIFNHLQAMKDSAMEFTLDLDNIHQIEPALKVMYKIINMENLVNVIPNLCDPVNEAKKYFLDSVKCVLLIGEKEFNLDKWKQNDRPNIDLEKAGNILNYLNTYLLKGGWLLVGEIRGKITTLINDVQTIMKEYSLFVEQDMQSAFITISTYDGNNKENLYKSVQILSNRLQEISQSKHNILQLFNDRNVMNNWKRKLASYFLDISHDLMKFNAINNLFEYNNTLTVVKTLSQLDDFLDNDKFIDLYKTHRDLLFAAAPQATKDIIDIIKTHDYQKIYAALSGLEKANNVLMESQLNQLKPILNNSINDLAEETISKSRLLIIQENCKLDKIEYIVQNLTKLQNAKNIAARFLDFPQNLDNSITKIQNLICQGIFGVLKRVEGLINSNSFNEADTIIIQINLMCNILGVHCSQEVIGEFQKLKKRQEKTLDELVAKYEKMDIKEYYLHPPVEIFIKLQPSHVYIDTIRRLEEIILSKFRETLKNINSLKFQTERESGMNILQSLLVCLPERVKLVVTSEINQHNFLILEEAKVKESTLMEAIKNKDLDGIVEFIKKHKALDNLQSLTPSIRKFIRTEAEDYKSQIMTIIKERRLTTSLFILKNIHDIKKNFQEHFSAEFHKPYSEVIFQLERYFETNSFVLKHYFDYREELVSCENNFYSMLHSSSESLNLDSDDEAFCARRYVKKNETTPSEALDFLIELVKFRRHFANVLKDLLPNFDTELIKIVTKIAESLNKTEIAFDNAFKSMDILVMNNVLLNMKKWDYLYLNLKSNLEIFEKIDVPMHLFMKVLTTGRCYSDMIATISAQIREMKNNFMKQDLINEQTILFKKQRDKFYQQLKQTFSTLINVKKLHRHPITVNIESLHKECVDELNRKVNIVVKDTENILTRNKLEKQDCENFNIHYLNLLSLVEHMDIQILETKKNIEEIEEKLLNKVTQFQNEAEKNPEIENVADCVITMKIMSDNIIAFKEKVDEKIDKVLGRYKAKHGGASAMAKLGFILDKDPIGKIVLAEHKAFDGFSVSLFNTRIQNHGINYVLEHLEGDFIDLELLLKRYTEYDEKYKALIKQYLLPKMSLDQLISDTKAYAGNVIHNQVIKWDCNTRFKIPHLVAQIFALWTLKNASYFFEAEGADNQDSYLFQPHPAQVISIFRILGIGDKKEELKSNLVQIGTGEGKSITLAVTASVLALLGCEISCACYSQYLSNRDSNAFQSLFDSLGISNFIHYGTFNKLCERIINKDGDVREIVKNLIYKTHKPDDSIKGKYERPQILLIDEVDVFFCNDFYGNTYTPCASLEDPTISNLINFIWKEKDSALNVEKIKATEEYRKCSERFKDWEFLIEESIKIMLFDIKNFKSHDYVSCNNKIGYKEQDGISYNSVYSYKTLFAYFYEYDKKTITLASLEENKRIRVNCGCYSYAKVPFEFKLILGVTGTLKTLSEPEKDVVTKEYKILRNTYMPSVFGKNNLLFCEKSDLKIENEHDYFNVIKKEIDNRLRGKIVDTQRAVLVFFESKTKLMEFYNSSAFSSMKDTAKILTEEASPEEKESLVKHATMSGQILLLTKSFGRGTDFISRDSIVAANGGVHVLQVFISEELSEEVQIKGRTARQGECGSYSLVVLDSTLEKFLIKKEEIEENKGNCYYLINEKRNAYFKSQYETNKDYIEHVNDQHKQSQMFMENIKHKKMDLVRKFLLQQNKGVEEKVVVCSKTICLMDATGSMGGLLQKAKNTVGTMFESACIVLKEHKIDVGSFQLQFAVYRDYDCGLEGVLVTSPWEYEPENLYSFMGKISAQGGGDYEEAIEIGLWHANQENERNGISQVILIGDAPPKTKAQITQYRNTYGGETHWKSSKFGQATFYQDELQKLINKKIPVHAFYVDEGPKISFEEIASKSGGKCEKLDINSPFGAKMLTDLVTITILQNIGGTEKGEALVQTYKAKFGKSYS